MPETPVDKSDILGAHPEHDELSIEPFEGWLEFLTDTRNLRPGLKSLNVYFGHFRSTIIRATFSDYQPSLRSLKLEMDDFSDEEAGRIFQEADAPGVKPWIYKLFEHAELEELIIPFKTSKMPDLFDGLPKLSSVDLSGSTLDELPPSFYQLSLLEKLKISFSGMRQVSSALGTLPLRSLSFSQSLPPQVLSKLTGLVELDCSTRQDEVLAEIAQLTNLRSLTLHSVIRIPDNLLSLKNLEKLNLTTHNTASFAFGSVADALPALKELKTNNAEVFAGVLGNFKNLEKLTINRRQRDSFISKLQESLAQLFNLQHVRLEGVGITQLDWCTSLSNLEFLDVRNNAIQSIPPGIGTLQKLDTIILTNNPITTFPELNSVPSVTFIDFQGTKIPIDEDASTDIQPIPEELSKLKRAFPNVAYLQEMGSS